MKQYLPAEPKEEKWERGDGKIIQAETKEPKWGV